VEEEKKKMSRVSKEEEYEKMVNVENRNRDVRFLRRGPLRRPLRRCRLLRLLCLSISILKRGLKLLLRYITASAIVILWDE
jgi:hypothetical protein